MRSVDLIFGSFQTPSWTQNHGVPRYILSTHEPARSWHPRRCKATTTDSGLGKAGLYFLFSLVSVVLLPFFFLVYFWDNQLTLYYTLLATEMTPALQRYRQSNANKVAIVTLHLLTTAPSTWGCFTTHGFQSKEI